LQKAAELEHARRALAIQQAKEREAAAMASVRSCAHFLSGFCAAGPHCQLKHDLVERDWFQAEQVTRTSPPTISRPAYTH